MDKFDLIVIGAGPGGYMAALEAAKYGMKTALVEKDRLGGTCLNRGCIPTKTLMHSSELYREMKSAQELGIYADQLRFDLRQIYERKDAVVGQLHDGIAGLMKKHRITVYEGLGRIDGEHQVTVVMPEKEETVCGEYILIASGSEPAVPPIPGANLPGVITSDELLQTDILDTWGADQKRLVVIGGGVIGLEFASVFNALDYSVTVIEALDRILANMDREISQNTKMIYKKRGIDFHTGAAVERIESSDDGSLICHYTEKDKHTQVAADRVLMAVGRRPYIRGLFGPDFKPETDRGRLVVNEFYQTNYAAIYAIGDVIGGIQLAHAATAEGICAVEHMAVCRAAGGVAEAFSPSYNMSAVPSCVYTDPEIASVGLTSDEAKKLGIDTVVKKYPMSANGKSLLSGQDRGFIKLVARSDNHVLLGAQMMCGRATDMIGEAAAAIVNGLTLEEMAAVIHPHPTFCEGIGEALRS